MKTGSIYLVTNTLNGKRYIGQTIQSPIKRWKEHCVKRTGTHFSNALNLYGSHCFEISVVESPIEISQLNSRETFWVSHYDTFNNGYNMTTGGKQDCIRSEVTKIKLREYWGGRPRGSYSKDRIDKMKVGMEIRTNLYRKEICIIDETIVTRKNNHKKKDIIVRYRCLGCNNIKQTKRFRIKEKIFCHYCCKNKIT
jgi:group I intron endonuclease